MMRFTREAMEQAALMAELSDLLIHVANNDIDLVTYEDDAALLEERTLLLDEVDRVETAISLLGDTGLDTDVGSWMEAQSEFDEFRQVEGEAS